MFNAASTRPDPRDKDSKETESFNTVFAGSRTAKDPVRLRWAIVVLMSAQGQTVKDTSSLMQER
ncbi:MULTISPECIES: hypothetical protein [unclassified Streptomyces]|uniref:hypothetical protein n=1 Tax=unclassified Streptomyces TaxID=2593676 RepID=UPI00336A50D9